MKAADLPADVRRYLLTSVPSVPYLEAILLLRAERDAWDAARLARRLYVSEKQALDLLQGLASAGIATAVEDARGWAFAPASAELASLLDAVSAAYAAHLVMVTDLIHSRLDKRAQQFADAFRFRKDS